MKNPECKDVKLTYVDCMTYCVCDFVIAMLTCESCSETEGAFDVCWMFAFA